MISKAGWLILVLAELLFSQDTAFIFFQQLDIPGYNDEFVILSRTNPRINEDLAISLVKGLWPDDCIPAYTSYYTKANTSDNIAGSINLYYESNENSDSAFPVAGCTDIFTPYGPEFIIDSLSEGKYCIIDGADTLETIYASETQQTFSVSAVVLKCDSASTSFAPYSDFLFSFSLVENDYIPGSGYSSLIDNSPLNSNGIIHIANLAGKTYRLTVKDNATGYQGSTSWFNLKSDTTIYFAINEYSQSTTFNLAKNALKTTSRNFVLFGSRFHIPESPGAKCSHVNIYGLNGRKAGSYIIEKAKKTISIGGNKVAIAHIE